MNTRKMTLAEVLEAATADGEWVNGEFEAMVTNAKPPVGRKPSKATLVDPDNQRTEISVNWFSGDLTRYEGSRCLFHGQGMKVKEYRGKAELNLSDKSLINVVQGRLQQPAGSEQSEQRQSASRSTQAIPPAVSPAEKAKKFHLTLKKISLLWLHAAQYAEDAWNKLPDSAPIRQCEGGFQSLVSTIYISARDEGMMNIGVPLRSRAEDGSLEPFVPAPDDDDARKAAEELERRREQERKEREERERREREALDQDVPF